MEHWVAMGLVDSGGYNAGVYWMTASTEGKEAKKVVDRQFIRDTLEGYGVSGKYWSSGYHTGVDFPVGSGTPVYAVGDGQVFDTGYNSAYGNYVEIYHGNNVYSFYAHASRVNVSKGQKVTKGQQIMLSGATGNVTGAHLHVEIRSPGYGYSSCVNPMKYLP